MPESTQPPAEYTGRHKRPSAKRAKRVTEDAEFLAMLARLVRRAEARAIDNPACLPQLIKIAQLITEAPNVVIARSAAAHESDPRLAPSINEISKLIKMSRQSVQDRRKLGDRTLFERSMGDDMLTRGERRARTVEERRLAAEHAELAIGAWLARKDEATR